MSAEITIPRLGWSMEEGIFVRWLKQEGELVKRGDQLFLLESEKATQEIESLDEGYLHFPANAPQPGDTVLVGQVIGILTVTQEVPQPTEPQEPAHGNGADAPRATIPVAGPAARRLARQLKVGLEQVAGTGRGGRITSADVQAEVARQSPRAPVTAGDRGAAESRKDLGAAQSQESRVAQQVAVTPRARRAARGFGVDPGSLQGTGRQGRVRERDVLAAAKQETQHTARGIEEATRSTKTDNVRRTIARRMVASHTTTAPVTLTTTVDATNLVALRGQFQTLAQGENEIVPSITDFVVKLLSIALIKHPGLNARWENEQVVEIAATHIGVAVDAEAGLLVPVIRDVQTLGVRQVASQSRELVAKARAGTLSLAELQGGTITVTNLGMYGIDAFTPIINPPEAAILGLGAIRREPVFTEGNQVVARERMAVSLTFDHRVVDGAPAARFLATLRTGIENPAVWLAG